MVGYNAYTLATGVSRHQRHRWENKMEKENKAMELFGYGYEDSVIAARTGLLEEDVKVLRIAWERWE